MKRHYNPYSLGWGDMLLLAGTTPSCSWPSTSDWRLRSEDLRRALQ